MAVKFVPGRGEAYTLAMTEAIAFDTHRFVKRLTESGFTEQQAETLAEEHVALLNANLATKADIAAIEAGRDAFRQETMAGRDAFRQETRAGMDAFRQETRAGMDAFRQETRAAIAAVEAGMDAFRQEIKAEMDALRQETRAAIAAVEAGMDAFRQEIKAEMDALRQETKADIEAVKAEMLKWLLGALIAQGGLIVALIKLF